jgi:hypothetical protein
MRRLELLRAVLVVGFLPMGGCSDRPIVVRTVSDRTGLGMAGIRVQVADQPWATTDADGKAIFATVSGTFTVSPATVPSISPSRFRPPRRR